MRRLQSLNRPFPHVIAAVRAPAGSNNHFGRWPLMASTSEVMAGDGYADGNGAEL